MKYVLRQGMFETNSSSTHSVSFSYGNKKYRTLEEMHKLGEEKDAAYREIRSKKYKALYLFQIKYSSLIDPLAANYYKMEDFIEDNPSLENIKGAKEIQEKMAKFRELLAKEVEFDEEDNKLMDEALKWVSTRYITEIFFWNGPLDDYADPEYKDLKKVAKAKYGKTNDEAVIKAVLDDDFIFELYEYWAGGYSGDIDEIY